MNLLNARIRKCSMWLALALASSSVLAGPAGDRLRGRDERAQSARPFTHQGAAERPQSPDYQREGQRPQRLSPEERRQLRSDIRDAGREIYPQRR